MNGWTLQALWAIPESYYDTILEMAKEEANK
jgi:hypothetical protein